MHYTPPAFTIVSPAGIAICRHRLHRHSCTSYYRLLLEKKTRKEQNSHHKQTAFLNLDSMPGIDGLYTPTYTAAKNRNLVSYPFQEQIHARSLHFIIPPSIVVCRKQTIRGLIAFSSARKPQTKHIATRDLHTVCQRYNSNSLSLTTTRRKSTCLN